MKMTKQIVSRFEVIRDQGYGRVYARIYNTQTEAEASMAKWKREGIEHLSPLMQNGGELYINETDYEIREDGAEFPVSIF